MFKLRNNKSEIENIKNQIKNLKQENDKIKKKIITQYENDIIIRNSTRHEKFKYENWPFIQDNTIMNKSLSQAPRKR